MRYRHELTDRRGAVRMRLYVSYGRAVLYPAERGALDYQEMDKAAAARVLKAWRWLAATPGRVFTLTREAW